LPYGLTLLVDYKYIWLGRENFPVAYPTPFETHRLNVPGVTVVPGWKIEASYALSELSPESGLSACLDADISGRELVVRTWQRGDRFVPLGMCAEKKLAEFMRNEKIPRRWRQNIPVVASPEKIIWLVGFRLDDRVKVTKATRRILRLEFKMDGEAATDVARCP
jgi:tRNA(Ile)-lysidine synthase